MVQVPAIAATAWDEISGGVPPEASVEVGASVVVSAAVVVGVAEVVLVVGAAEVVVVVVVVVLVAVTGVVVVVVVVFLLEQPTAPRDKTRTATNDRIITLFFNVLLLLKLNYCITYNTGGQYVV
jgi:hypothetical protein